MVSMEATVGSRVPDCTIRNQSKPKSISSLGALEGAYDVHERSQAPAQKIYMGWSEPLLDF